MAAISASKSATTAIPVDATAPTGFWERESDHYPLPLSPMYRSLALPAGNAAIRKLFDAFSLLSDGLEQREIGGWLYMRLLPLGGKEGKPPPVWLMPLLIRVVPPLRRRVAGCVRAMRGDLHGRLIERWYNEWRPEYVHRIAALRAVDLASQTDAELETSTERVISLLDNGAEVHFLLHGALCMLLGDLAFTCRDLLGWEDGKVFDLMAGLSDASTAPAQGLAALAWMAKDRPEVRALIAQRSRDAARRLPEVDAEFAAAFDAYLKEYGCRALRYEVAGPALEETPELLLGLIGDQMARGYDLPAETAARARTRTETEAEAQRLLAARSPAERARFARVLPRAQRAYPVREDNEFYTVSAPMALVRFAALELGRRLAERRQIAGRDDVFFLEMDEARQALRDGSDMRTLVARRQGERAWVEAHPGPPSYGTEPPPPPSLAAFPPEVRFAMEALMWVLPRVSGTGRSGGSTAKTGALRGTAVAPGSYTGPARVILNEDEFDKLQAGDVLVCPITSPVWSVLFPSVGALVTDTGGTLSHPAIIAREFGIPAVAGTGAATRTLKDGQMVRVDGNDGSVTVLAM